MCDLAPKNYSMLGLNGIDLSRKILQIRRDIPILLQTGYNASISGEALREAGIRGFAYKPLLALEMVQTIRQILDGATVLPD